MSAPSSAPSLAACATTSTLCSLWIFGPRGYIIASSGMPWMSHLSATLPSFSSILSSSGAPTFMCTETASAPMRMASCTVHTWTLLFALGVRFDMADKCTISPALSSSTRLAMPLFSTMASTPPFRSWSIMFWGLVMPLIGPMLTPWSMGTITVRLSFWRILFSRRFLPCSMFFHFFLFFCC